MRCFRLLALLLFAWGGFATPLGCRAQKRKSSAKEQGLNRLLEDHWNFTLQSNPLFATHLGVHDYDDQLADPTEEARKARLDKKASFLKRASMLPQQDDTTLALLVESLSTDLATEACQFHLWSISPRQNPVVDWNYLPELHQVKSKQDFENLLARYRGIARSIDEDIKRLRQGLKQKLVSNRESARRIVELVTNQLQSEIDSWPLMSPLKIAPSGTESAAQEMKQVVETSIKPALKRYRDFVKTEILPVARDEEHSGLSSLPLGKDCYKSLIRKHTTLTLSASEIHQIGLREVERIDAEMAKLGQKLFGLDDRKAVLAHLRNEKDLFFSTSEQVETKAASSLKKAKEAIPKYFGVLPQADCIIRKIPDYEAPYTTIAYYRQPTPDGSKPGEYFVNVHAPETRPRYEAEVLAYHESIPGHHLQIAIAQELPELPEFRKHLGLTAFVEGWALYTEQLADEMGLYESDLDRMGMHSFEAWRAARLVVDTGIHEMGWSRSQAKAFMAEHTALALNNIDNEVDRYIVWPGQALAYKIGQLEFWQLRTMAEETLKDQFDIRAFHAAALKGGSVTLGVLKKQIRDWIKETQGGIHNSAP